jgi:UDP-glucose 4-epimerase
MTSTLITGRAGYIGSHIVEQLIKSDEKVVILDNLVTGHIKLINKKAKFIKADIKNKSQIISIIRDNNITSIIHLAAYLNISEAEKIKKNILKTAYECEKKLI